MEKTIKKPTFREVVAVTTITMHLPDVNLAFNSQRVGPTDFNGLRNADYGAEFIMSTMPELAELVYASLENPKYKTAKIVIDTLKNYWLAGNTAVHYFPEGMFVEDNPELENGRIVTPPFKSLEKKLEHEKKGVAFSNDKNIRFTPYNFRMGSQSPLEFSKNAGVIALAGSEEKAEKIAEVSGHYRVDPYFWVLSNVNSPQTRVADLNSRHLDDGLYIGAGYFGGDVRCSFGMLDKSVEGTRKK